MEVLQTSGSHDVSIDSRTTSRQISDRSSLPVPYAADGEPGLDAIAAGIVDALARLSDADRAAVLRKLNPTPTSRTED
jgi:hypothetical protein